MRRILFLFAFTFISIIVISNFPKEKKAATPPPKPAKVETAAPYSDEEMKRLDALEARLAYLYDIPEISEVVFEGNHVYLGFERWTLKMGTVTRAAAYHGNKVYGRRVHVYACKYDPYEPDPRDWPLFCSATGQDGKVKRCDCN